MKNRKSEKSFGEKRQEIFNHQKTLEEKKKREEEFNHNFSDKKKYNQQNQEQSISSLDTTDKVYITSLEFPLFTVPYLGEESKCQS